jgi:hypothetical protein
MELRKEVADQLLLSKSLLEKIRLQAAPNPDRFSLATHILTAHDAAELALAAIAAHVGKMPGPNEQFLMKYLDKLKELHPERDVVGRGYFIQLNRVRVDIKHFGVFPDPSQWFRVADTVYGYVSALCSEYLALSLDDLDESTLLISDEVKRWYDLARDFMAKDEYREVLECLAIAMFVLFRESAGLRGLAVGRADAGTAIKLTGFGVHANDYLALQEFLPTVEEGTLAVKWQQERFGHPGNWHQDAAAFCLNSFLDVALKIQATPWIPGAIEFRVLYEDKVTALRDGVEIRKEMLKKGEPILGGQRERQVVKRLAKGESICGTVAREQSLMVEMLQNAPPSEPRLDILSSDTEGKLQILSVAASDVKVTCVPRDSDSVRKYYPNLPELEWKPEK